MGKAIWGGDISQPIVKYREYPACGRYSQPYSAYCINKTGFSFPLLARPGCAKRSPRWTCVLPLFLTYFIFILTIFVGPIISLSSGPIFTKFAGLVELWLLMKDLKLVFRPSRNVAVATNFCWFYRLLSTELGSHGIR